MPALVRLRRVHQKRVTQVHGAGFARGRDHTPASGRGKAIGSELPERQPLLSCGRELPALISFSWNQKVPIMFFATWPVVSSVK